MNRRIGHVLGMWAAALGMWAALLVPAVADAQTATAKATERVAPDIAVVLRRAYQKELAFLTSQRDALKARKAELERSHAERMQRLKAEMGVLQNNVVAASLAANRAEDRLAEADRMREVWQDRWQRLLNILEQGFAGYGINQALPEVGASSTQVAKALGELFAQSDRTIRLGAQVRLVADETYFDRTGKQQKGDVWALGQIARLAEGQGPLVPAGEGRFQLYTPKEGDAVLGTTLRQPASQAGTPLLTPIFLYESTEKAIDPPTEKTFASYVEAGGLVGKVIMALGFAALVMLLIRSMVLLWASRGQKALVARVRGILSSQNADADPVADAVQSLQSQPGGALGRVLAKVLPHAEGGGEAFERALAEGVAQESIALDRFGTAIAVAAAVAPLLGLLGTVTGMISTFDIITEFGTGDPKLLSKGISEALVTTQLGLIVAIPALTAGGLLSAYADGVVSSLERYAMAAAGWIGAPAGGTPRAPVMAVPNRDESMQHSTQRIVQALPISEEGASVGSLFGRLGKNAPDHASVGQKTASGKKASESSDFNMPDLGATLPRNTRGGSTESVA